MTAESRPRGGLRPLLELGAVFLGVLIALAADAWWQGREEIDREMWYLRAIQADMTETIEDADVALGQDSVQRANATEFLGLLRSAEPRSAVGRRVPPGRFDPGAWRPIARRTRAPRCGSPRR